MVRTPLPRPSGSWSDWHDPASPLRLGVSACLLGQEVRYDGGHRRNRFVVETLGPWVEWVPVCPEVDIGLGVPRPTIRLEEHAQEIRLVQPDTGRDFTEQMRRYSRKRVRGLMRDGLDGYILKKGSPSCGIDRLKIYSDGDPRRASGTGVYAHELMDLYPNLPVQDEGRLNDADIRENFVEQIVGRHRWRTMVARGMSRQRLVEFHTVHKMLLRAHNEAGYRRLRTIVGRAGQVPDRRLFSDYEDEFHRVMRTRTTRKRHANVLQHAMGYLKRHVGGEEKEDILTAIDAYASGLTPLLVPLTLLRFNIRKHDIDDLKGQLYFDPHPRELMLRYHA